MWSIRNLVRGVVSFALLGAGLSVPLMLASPAQACSCVEMSPGSLAEQADSVFIATLQTEETVDGETTATFLVTDVYKGASAGEVTVSAPADEAGCGVEFETDTQYLVVANGAKDKLSTNLCSGTQEVNDQVIADVRKSLGEPTSYRPGVGDDNDNGDNGDSENGDSDNTGDTGESNDSADDTEEAAADTSDDGDSNVGTTILIGTLLIVGFGLAFLAPRLRRRNRE